MEKWVWLKMSALRPKNLLAISVCQYEFALYNKFVYKHVEENNDLLRYIFYA